MIILLTLVKQYLFGNTNRPKKEDEESGERREKTNQFHVTLSLSSKHCHCLALP